MPLTPPLPESASGEASAGLPPGPAAALPLAPQAHLALADARRGAGDELGALAHEVAARVLGAWAGRSPGTPTTALDDLCTVATGYFMKGEHAAAEAWYALLLQLDPRAAVAHLNLAAIHAARGDPAAAEASRRRAYALQRVFVEPLDAPTRRLLILCAGDAAGNVPIDPLLAGGRSLRIKVVIDHLDRSEEAGLPAHDLVFNAVGDADVALPLAARLEDFAARCARPLLNPPAAVARTRRDRLAGQLGGLPDVVVPACSRHAQPPQTAAELAERCAPLLRDGAGWPLLLRPVASHGGLGLVRCADFSGLRQALGGVGGAHYLTAFHDTRGPDGQYRKYRVVFVDRRPWPYHLAISADWMVHYASAGMAQAAWKLAEEQRFLCDPATVLGPRATAALQAIGERLDLDYAGIDFSLLADGRLLVFEANPTMLVHRERLDGPLAHKNAPVERIYAAFEALLLRAGAAGGLPLS